MLNERDTSGFPGAYEAERVHPHHCCVLRAFAGHAEVRVRGDFVRVSVGECLVVPAGVAYEITVFAGGLVVPVLIDADSAGSRWAGGPYARVEIVRMDSSWNTWILHHFATWISPMRSPDYRGDELLQELLHEANQVTDSVGAMPLPFHPPELPTTVLARRVAEYFQRFPEDTRTLQAHAEDAGTCTRTLRRMFLRDTGMTPGVWRRLMRLHAACEYLVAGYSVEWTAHRVGFSTSQGFIQAFVDCVGSTPARWSAEVSGPWVGVGERVGQARRSSRLAQVLESSGVARQNIPTIPAVVSLRRCHPDHHVMLWVYCGSARVRIDDREFGLVAGDAVWMPAGHSHEVMVDEASVALPLSFSEERVDIDVDDVVVTRVPQRLSNFMLHNVISTLTRLRPLDYDAQQVLDVFDGLALRARDRWAGGVQLPSTPAARVVAQKTLATLADGRGAQQWAQQSGVSSRTLNRWFRLETGYGYVAWRTEARITAARWMLDRGRAPKSVAFQLGYRHLSGFSRDFHDRVGMSPRDYARRVEID